MQQNKSESVEHTEKNYAIFKLAINFLITYHQSERRLSPQRIIVAIHCKNAHKREREMNGRMNE